VHISGTHTGLETTKKIRAKSGSGSLPSVLL